jgi:hypothetical protein
MTNIVCPHCETAFQISMKESLKPYSVVLRVHPIEGRMIAAETLSRQIFSLSKALKEAGRIVGHKTEVFFTDASVGEDMSIAVTVTAVPFSERRQGEAAA